MPPSDLQDSKRPRRIEDFPPAGPNALASLRSRGWARLIDALLADVPILIAQTVIVYPTLSDGLQPTAANEDLLRNLAPWLIGGWAVVSVLYETIAVGIWGRTIGKLALGIRVAQFSNGNKPSWTQAALRCLLPISAGAATFKLTGVPTLGACVIFASSYFNPLRRGWHDDAGGTIVIRTR